jgi:hypothetical protein
MLTDEQLTEARKLRDFLHYTLDSHRDLTDAQRHRMYRQYIEVNIAIARAIRQRRNTPPEISSTATTGDMK